jgi:hypothetical protein
MGKKRCPFGTLNLFLFISLLARFSNHYVYVCRPPSPLIILTHCPILWKLIWMSCHWRPIHVHTLTVVRIFEVGWTAAPWSCEMINVYKNTAFRRFVCPACNLIRQTELRGELTELTILTELTELTEKSLPELRLVMEEILLVQSTSMLADPGHRTGLTSAFKYVRIVALLC